VPLLVKKFGGTSVQSVEHIRQAADRVIKAKSRGCDVIVVLSAMGRETDRLIQLADCNIKSYKLKRV
jgi:aspartate kinase